MGIDQKKNYSRPNAVGDPLFRSAILCALLIALFSHTSFSQDPKRQYKSAMDLFNQGKYSLSMEMFKPLMVYDKNNPYLEYACFHYAVAAYRQGFKAVAKDQLLQMRKLYPEWDQSSEVNYWLAIIYFDLHEYFQGMNMLRQVKQEDYIAMQETAKLERSYLIGISDPEILRMMWENYPDDVEVGKALARAISRQPSVTADKQLLDSVITKFNLPREQYALSLPLQQIMKDKYNVSVLFPFLTATLDPSPGRKQNQVMLDLYEGMRLANDSLRKTGVNINLLAYDTDRNPETVKKLLATEEIRNTDLIVGPLFRDEVKPVLNFSQTNQTNMFNPVQNYSDYIAEDPFAYLYQPSYETIGLKSAQVLAKRLRNKNCMIFYGDKPKDSVMAVNFANQAKELGLNVTWAEEFRKETAARILTILATPTEYDEFKNPKQFKLKKDSIGSIFVASDDPLIYTKVISSVEARGDSVVVIGGESWLDNTSVDLTKYERLHVMFAAPNFTPVTSPSFVSFRRKYIKTHGSFPPEYLNYTKIGYDFMMFAGRALHKYGVNFQEGLAKDGLFPGWLTRGYKLSPNRDNAEVPFVYFRNGELMAIE
jgi:ABC-type branched-subunit amino acid transport system substrate-binding protein